MKILSVLAVTLLLSACFTGEKISNLYPGMSKQEVINVLGAPDGFANENGIEVFKYTNRLMSGWAWNRADYVAKFKDDKLIEYGANKIREHGHPLSSINVYRTNTEN